MLRQVRLRALLGAVVLWLGLALASVACGAPASTQAPVSNATAPATIRLAVNEVPEELATFQSIVNAFEQANLNIKVKLENIPDDDEFTKKLAADIAAQTPPDVFLMNYRRIGPFALKGALQSVDKYLNTSQVIQPGDFYPMALDAYKLKGELQCVPLNLSQLGVYYNAKLFQAAGVPLPKNDWTWNDFLAAARALTQDTNGDGKPDQYGAGISTLTIRLMPFVWAHGGDIVDNPERPTSLTLDKGAALEAFQWFVALQTKEHVVPDKTAEATQSSQARFEAGTLAMFFQSRVLTPELRETVKDKFVWDIAPLPQDKNRATILHSDGFCITNGSKNKDAAWKLVEYIAGPQGQTALAKVGRNMPALQAVANSPAFLKSNPPANNQVYLDMAPYVRPVPLMTTWLEVESAVNKEIKRAFYGDASVEEAAQAAVETTREYFKQNLADLGSP
ncbi:MAG: sugar ABC transporter substrate-binding protein [Chloroflexi bacterium]|nr:sugar ABC transporter substrate-binding protein [Chloroflexota bacterium]